jgi:hypothetical protein
MRRLCATVVAASVLVATGCSRHGGGGLGTTPSSAPTPTAASEKDPAAAPNAAPGKLDRPDLGVRLEWPQGWVPRHSDDYELLLKRPAQGGDDDAAPSLSLDVPDLPAHIPGMIPIGSVRKGYLDDLRKAVGPIKTTDLTPPTIPASAERMVQSTWSDSKKTKWQETALMLVHADHVYIIRARSTASDEAVTRDAFDQVVHSLQWTKKGSTKASQTPSQARSQKDPSASKGQ